MPSPTEPESRKKMSAEIFAVCLLLAASLQIMENLLPKVPVFPWLRLGLAYLIILPFMIRYGAGSALLLFLCRNLLSLAYGGQVFSSFLISTLSGCVTLGLVGPLALWTYRKKLTGLLGFSILLAAVFNMTQLAVVNFLIVRHHSFFFQLSPLLIWSLVSGSLIAFLIYKSRTGLDQLFERGLGVRFYERGSTDLLPDRRHSLKMAVIAGLFGLILVGPGLTIQGGILAGILVLTRFHRLKTVFFAWPFLFYIAWLHLFHTDGVYLIGDWITRQGLERFGFYSLRTINLILCGQWLAGYIPQYLNRHSDSPYIKGMGYALPLLPSLFGISIAMGRTFFHRLRRRQFDNLLYPVITTLGDELAHITKEESNG